MSVIIGSIIEAWDELRIHKLRVLLSLIGVAVAVAAMTGVLAVAQILAQANEEMAERWNGRDTTLTININVADTHKSQIGEMQQNFIDEFSVEFASRTSWASATIGTGNNQVQPDFQAVDVDYAVIKNLKMKHGAWFTEGDAQRLAPTVVVNEAAMRQLRLPPEVVGGKMLRIEIASQLVDAFLVGVEADDFEDDYPRMYMLWDSWFSLYAADDYSQLDPYSQLLLWITPDQVHPATQSAQAYFLPYTAEGSFVDVWDNSGNMGDQENFMRTFQLIVLGIGGVILAIGALSLVNISLVTVQQRIREIGIRRAFGATTGRVFFSIMTESVVATFLAGAVGVLFAVFIVGQFPVVEMLLGNPVENPPPFPFATALMGIGMATGIGALAGLIPGIVATRIKPIEAMRSA